MRTATWHVVLLRAALSSDLHAGETASLAPGAVAARNVKLLSWNYDSDGIGGSGGPGLVDHCVCTVNDDVLTLSRPGRRGVSQYCTPYFAFLLVVDGGRVAVN